MMPSEQAPVPSETPEPIAVERPVYKWYQKAAAVLLVTFCIEIGFFLLIFPWTDSWENNYIGGIIPRLGEYWDNLYVRGAISGIGAVNLYIALLELFRLRRFARN